MTIPVSEEVATYLRDLSPVHEDQAAWGDGTMPLQISAYLTAAPPPDAFVSSVRGLLLDGPQVLVIQSQDDTHHILPGGRREEGESLEDTLLRELVEETGYEATCGVQLGVVHFHHLKPAPPGFPYPHPDFLWLVFRATAVRRIGDTVMDDWEKEALFRPVGELGDLRLSAGDLAFLEAALSVG